MGETIRLGEHSLVLCGSERGKYPSGNPLLVEGTDGRLAIDSAVDVELPEVDIVALSHFHEDHTVGLSERPGLDVRVHALDLEPVQSVEAFFAAGGYPNESFRDDLARTFRHGALPQATAFDLEPIDLGGVTVRPIPLPGHTPGHCGFIVEPDGVFVTADIDLSSFGPFYGDLGSSLTDMRASLQRAAQVEARAFLTFHHKREVLSAEEFASMLATFAEVIDQRAERVLTLVREASAPVSADDLVGKGVVYRPGRVPSYAANTERRMTELHLDELAADGKIQREGDRFN